jgi:hypothetical protein
MSFPALNPRQSSPSTPLGPVPVRLTDGAPVKKLLSAATAGGAAVARITLSGGSWWQQRVAVRRIARAGGRNVLIVGAGRLGREMAAILEQEPLSGRTVVGFLDGNALVEGDVLGRWKTLPASRAHSLSMR